MDKEDKIKISKEFLLEMKQLIAEQNKALTEKEAIIKAKDTEIAALNDREEALVKAKDIEIAVLTDRVASLLLALYGKKSEKLKLAEEPPIFDEPNLTPEEQAEAEAVDAEITIASHTRKRPSRAGIPIDRKLPEALERIPQVYDLPEAEKICACGGCLHYIGDECSEKLEIIPAQIRVIVITRKKYACRACTDGIKTAEAPPVLIPKSIVTPALLAHVIIAKYEDHLPLYRQEAMWKRLGIDLARQTLCNWVLKAAEAFEPLMPVLQSELLSQGYVQVDETPVQIMEANKVRLSKKAYMWVIYSGPYPKVGVIYKFAMDRSAANPNVFFENYRGYLQTDGYSGYNNIKKQDGVKGLVCWAHARRKFVDIVKKTKQVGAAHYAVDVIAKLYKIEKEISANSTPEKIVEIRQAKSKPILEAFLIWLKERNALPKGPLGTAINYCLDRWDELMVYLEDGRLNIDNNYCENIIRPFTLGRKNWLFMGNERGGKAAATLYSLINTCKLNKINTLEYLTCLITELPKINPKNKDELKNLLPQYYCPGTSKDLLISSE